MKNLNPIYLLESKGEELSIERAISGHKKRLSDLVSGKVKPPAKIRELGPLFTNAWYENAIKEVKGDMAEVIGKIERQYAQVRKSAKLVPFIKALKR